ncbi:unnamed protein product, partial [Litomosoides sigmodontis]
VVGGRRSDTGRLGAFITQVKPGSVADVVGRLRRGDEVLEWNGRQLQNATYDQVYDTINLSRNDAQVELIVSRSLSAPGGDDFLNVQRMLPNPAFLPSGGSGIGDYYLSNSLESSGFSHLQSGITSPHTQPFINAPSNYHPSLICKATADSSVYDTAGSSRVIACDDYCRREFGRGQIFGGIEISLYYGAVERQLVVTVRHAIDLPPRPDGAARNPYVKLFLLPDRSEKSRRQSAVLVETCNPIWNEPFYYHGLTKAMLMERVLEVTVWDYDQYEANSFMGEVLIDFTIAQLDDEPFLYTLVDMHEDNPLRAKIQQRRLNIYHASPRSQNEAGGPYMNIHQKGVTNYTTTYEAYQPVSRQQRMTHSNYGIRQSRTCDRSGTRTNEDWVAIYPSGYLSDHGYSNEMPMRYSHRERRPRSATAMRPLSDMQTNNRNLPPAPWVADEDDGQQMAVAVPNSTHAQTRFPRDPRSPGERLRLEAMHEQQPGYGSDGSETISIHSAQSVPARQSMRHITNGESEQVSMNQQMDDNVEEYIEEGAISDSMIAKGGIATATKDRKKSLMTRLIPGRNAPLEGKRTGFQRSEEVGIPEGLTVPGETPFMQQTSKESTDSSHSDNWGPILTDGPLGSFVESLGPGQVVGRQVLASPVLGEIQIGIATDRAGIDVEIIRAKNLVVKPGVKVNPAPYVKVYLLEGKQCIAKAKTRAIRRTTTPVFQQHIVFSETPRRKMLQITVMADYGRMERKSFMGIAQIRLDDLELSAEPMVGWYKLYHSSSLAGTGPVHKDSDTSFEIKQ